MNICEALSPISFHVFGQWWICLGGSLCSSACLPAVPGPMVWYQKFEYAVGHWLQKTAEHVLGSVLCSPGCFSLFRGSALMDDNVMKRYTTTATRASEYVQYDQGRWRSAPTLFTADSFVSLHFFFDSLSLSLFSSLCVFLGEDRWLCTLLLQQGWRVEYNAASDAYTNSPEEFKEFYNQRRRWGPSTLANTLDLLHRLGCINIMFIIRLGINNKTGISILTLDLHAGPVLQTTHL